MVFRILDLPYELALEIIRLAAFARKLRGPKRLYENALSLALVSRRVRWAVMPHLLHTVILNSQESINLFLRTLRRQQHYMHSRSPLYLNYEEYVHRIWATECVGPLPDSPKCAFQNYHLLRPLFMKANSLGFNFKSLDLIYEVLGGISSDDFRVPLCPNVTFAGENPRWNMITSTAAGMAFLGNIQYLTIWLPANGISGPSPPPNSPPNWIQKIPFQHLHSLKRFAFTLVDSTTGSTPSILLHVYNLPCRERATVFRTWATSSDPFRYGKTFRVVLGYNGHSSSLDASWEMAYFLGENNICLDERIM